VVWVLRWRHATALSKNSISITLKVSVLRLKLSHVFFSIAFLKPISRVLGAEGWGQLGCALRWRHTTAPSTSSKLIYRGKQGCGATVLWGGCDIVVIGNRRNLQLLCSKRKHLRKRSCAALCPHPLLELGPCQLSLQIIGYSCAYLKFS
jgi:hypothetical protein